jgi:hypothetical protein
LSNFMRVSSADLELHELLKKPCSELLGVSAAAADVLGKEGIKTIFDLGTSNLFASARAAMEMAQAGTPSGRFGLASGDLLKGTAQYSALEDIPKLSIDNLRLLTPQRAEQISVALDVNSIRDLALWPPYLATRRLVSEASGSTEEPEDLQAEELRPRFGQFPTERVYYETLVMLEMLGQAGAQQDLTGSVSIDPAVQAGISLTRPAIGALLSFSQSWYSQGVTLGHMLHSLALAPGEATRIAVIDWSKRTRAVASETIAESERLDNASLHSRALSEVQSAVADDFQAGGSQSSSASTSTSKSRASSMSTGFLASLFTSGSGSSTEQSASTGAWAESSSWSIGNRSVLASMAQNVNDRTEQHSSSVRNRRATAVREVSQSEHEEVSTRIVANYNHMHALTIQYYEVVQVYRTVAQLHRADRCFFVPMELLNFSEPNGIQVVERFRAALISAALNNRIRSLLIDDTTAVQIKPVLPVKFLPYRPDLLRVSSAIRDAATRSLTPATGATAPSVGAAAAPAPAPSPTPAPGGGAVPHNGPTIYRVWDDDAVAMASHVIDRPLVRPDSDSLNVPDDTELLSISFDNLNIGNVRIDRVGVAIGESYTMPADSARIDLPRGVPVIDLQAININKTDQSKKSGTMTLFCSYLGRRFTLPPIPVELEGTATQKVVEFRNDQADRRKELLQHLQSHRDYYSQAVFRSLDSVALTLILSRYRWNGKPLIDQVEPRPVTVAGNYLVLRAPVANTEDSGIMIRNKPVKWQDLLRLRGLEANQQSDERMIPIPTGGVFAEAVLGRSNSAEKLDITRFWNWKDSPIPLSPPEISPVQTGSRATPEDLKPGQLSPPVLNILNPTNLPAPDSISAVLGALSSMNFRDMSGLAGTQSLARAAMEGTLDAATEAGKLASENLKAEAQKAVAMGQIAADIAKTAITAGASKAVDAAKGKGVDGISGDGARINHGRSMDKRKVPGPKGSSSPPSNSNAELNGEATENPGSGDALASGELQSGGGASDTGYSHESSYADQGAFGYSPSAVNALTEPYDSAAIASSDTESTDAIFASDGGFLRNVPGLRSLCTRLQTELIRWTRVKRELVRIANDEYVNTWNRGARVETDPAMHPIIRRYWSEGVYEGIQQPPVNIPATAWSAAFIAWVVNEAGGGDRFGKFGLESQYRAQHRPSAHRFYLEAAKHNQNNALPNPFWSFRIDKVKPEVGDIVIKSRSGSGATYENFEGADTHGDIVVEVRRNQIVVIGGNVSQSVSRKTFALDANGFIQSTGGGNDDHFAIVRIVTDLFDWPVCKVMGNGQGDVI